MRRVKRNIISWGCVTWKNNAAFEYFVLCFNSPRASLFPSEITALEGLVLFQKSVPRYTYYRTNTLSPLQVAYGGMSVLVCPCRAICLHCVTPRTDICYWTVDTSIIYLVSEGYHLSLPSVNTLMLIISLTCTLRHERLRNWLRKSEVLNVYQQVYLYPDLLSVKYSSYCIRRY